MNLEPKDKHNIFLISILFIFVVILSIYISFSREKVHSFYDDMGFDLTNLTNLTNPNMFYNETSTDENCTFCEDHDIIKQITQKFEDAGIIDYLNFSSNIERPSISDLPSFSNFNSALNSSNCTQLFSIEESSKYSKKYKYTIGNKTVFYVSEKSKGKLNDFYIFETISEIVFDNYNNLIKIENYFLPNGNCVLSYYSTDLNNQGSQMECSGNYENFLCEEIINQLNYVGVEKYYTYKKNYDVYVYSSDDNSTILKYGKDIPILFYLKQEEEYNKHLVIELLMVEGVNV